MISTVEPGNGEALDTFLEACAAANGVSLRRFASHAGILDDTSRFPPLWGAAVSERIAAQLDGTLGIDATSMTLQRYHPNAIVLDGLDVTRPTTMRIVLRRQWLHLAGSRYCSECLAQGLPWQLAWKLPWSFACVTHRVWMHDTCPGCRRRPRSYSDKPTTQPAFPTRLTHRTRCPNRPRTGTAGAGRAAMPCGTDLACVVAHRCPTRIVEAQQTINDWLDRHHVDLLGERRTPRDGLHLVQAIAVWLKAAHQDRTTPRPWVSPPTTATEIGTNARRALQLLSGAIDDAAEQLALPLASLLTGAPSPRAALRERTSRSPVTDDLADAVAARFERTTTRQRRRATQLLLALNDTTVDDLLDAIDRYLDVDACRDCTGVDNRTDLLRDAVTIDVLLGHGARSAAHAADLSRLEMGAVRRHAYIRRLVNLADNRPRWLAIIDGITARHRAQTTQAAEMPTQRT